MARRLRLPRLLADLPAPIRWLALPLALTCTVVVLIGSWSAPEEIGTPTPTGKAAGYCQALAAALPQELLGRARKDPSPASPYVAGWAGGSSRIVLRCGVDRPDELNGEHAKDLSPTIDGVTWWTKKLSDGGYRFTTTLRLANVEVTVPGGASDNPLDPVAALNPAVKANIPS
ncbi:DUF3515 domain-containing protein [Kitasatospora sp. NBC_01560]|uniref:DUF3515 domain-containing protein n=1 Tax=Kitasatospora sp. NBC_01560 TaxID=2975965 RepID=UPI0038670567